MRHFFIICLVLLNACSPTSAGIPAPSQTIEVKPAPIFTSIPTFTPTISPTSTQPASLGTIALDFAALLCNAEWMNGAAHLTPCPNPNTNLSGGYAVLLDPASEGLSSNSAVLLMIPNAGALFLRYPPFIVSANDRFRTTLLCRPSTPCAVQFALGYYDAQGKYYDAFMKWDYKTGDAPISVDAGISNLAGQKVDFVLTLRIFHTAEGSQKDNGLWMTPHIYRPLP